ncbi:hypothetical protein SCUCBS95973_004658 [Sporothrix curviconia]|uniref:Ubiquitin conjugating enzyme n=1 Tax=Sporothrix curviconia TaxID=1260050 RepID=A0ABP0BS24_9PEZI
MSSHHQIAAMGLSVLRRSLESNPDTPDTPETPHGPTYNLPPLTWGLIALITLVFAPAFLYISYSVKSVYTTLAIVENPTPAAYETVASDETDAAPAAAPDAEGVDEETVTDVPSPSKPVTASLHRTDKLLRTVNGWRGNFRGFFLAVLIFILEAVGTLVLAAIPFLPPLVAGLIVSLALVQLQAAWVHTVIRANPSSTSIFRGGLPPFRRTFEATSIPTFLLWAANVAVTLVSLLVSRALKLETYDVRNPGTVPQFTPDMIWKTIVVFIVAISLVFTLTLPANVILIRVQASLLPPDEDTIVPFDRSFNGTVEPAVVGGRSYVTIKDALRTFSRASWKRVIILYIKLHVLSILVNVLYVAAVVPLVLLANRKADPTF